MVVDQREGGCELEDLEIHPISPQRWAEVVHRYRRYVGRELYIGMLRRYFGRELQVAFCGTLGWSCR